MAGGLFNGGLKTRGGHPPQGGGHVGGSKKLPFCSSINCVEWPQRLNREKSHFLFAVFRALGGGTPHSRGNRRGGGGPRRLSHGQEVQEGLVGPLQGRQRVCEAGDALAREAGAAASPAVGPPVKAFLFCIYFCPNLFNFALYFPLWQVSWCRVQCASFTGPTWWGGCQFSLNLRRNWHIWRVAQLTCQATTSPTSFFDDGSTRWLSPHQVRNQKLPLQK